MQARAEFPASRASAAEARRFAAATLDGWGCPDLADTVRLLVSELVVNAVSHATSPATLRMAMGDEFLRVEVEDRSGVLPQLRVASPDELSGRGLMIIDQLADRWGVEPTPDGKAVWFELRRSPVADPAS